MVGVCIGGLWGIGGRRIEVVVVVEVSAVEGGFGRLRFDLGANWVMIVEGVVVWLTCSNSLSDSCIVLLRLVFDIFC